MHNKPKYNQFKSTLKEIILSSPIYGLPSIVRTKRYFIKLIWIIGFLLSSSYGIFSFCNVLTDYFEYNVVTNFNTIYEMPMEFPTVSLCNINPPLYDNYSLKDIKIYCEFNNDPGECSNNYFRKYKDTYNTTCFEFNSNLSKIKYTTRSGKYYGLYIELITAFPILKNNYREHGYKIIIHNKSVVPSYTNEGIYASTGLATRLIINKIISERLSLPYNDCIKDIETYRAFDTKYFDRLIQNSTKIYRQKDCFDLCFHTYVIEMCNCATNLFKETEYSLCNSLTTLERCKRNVSDLFFIKLQINTLCNSYCPQECDSIQYQITTSTTTFPSLPYADKIFMTKDYINSTILNYTFDYEKLKKSILAVYVYYDDLKYTLISQKPKMKLDDLISNLGGTLGLFIGISFLSAFEIIEVILEFIHIYLIDNTNQKNEIDPD